MSTKGTWCASLYLEESVYASLALFVVAINLEFNSKNINASFRLCLIKANVGLDNSLYQAQPRSIIANYAANNKMNTRDSLTLTLLFYPSSSQCTRTFVISPIKILKHQDVEIRAFSRLVAYLNRFIYLRTQ